MEVDASGEDVGAGKPLETQLRTVSTSTYRLHLRTNATFLHSLQYDVDNVHVGLNHLFHVVVLILDIAINSTLTIFLVHLLCTFNHQSLACLKLVAVVVADYIGELCLFGIGVHSEQVEESLVSLSCLGSLVGRKHRCKFHGKSVGIDHLALCISWVHTHSVDSNLRTGSVEVLVFQFSQVATVHSVCPFTSKSLYVEVMGTHTDFLVGIKSHAYVAMLNLLVVAQIAHCLNNLGNTRLVVGTEQSVSVGYDKILTHMLKQFREFLRRGDDALREQNVTAVVVGDDMCLNVGSRTVRTSVVMTDESDGWHFLLAHIGFQCCIEIALVVELYILKSLAHEFLLKILGKHELFVGTGDGVTILSRLCVKLSVV